MARQFAPRRRTRRWRTIPGTSASVSADAGNIGGASAGFSNAETVVRMMGHGLFCFDPTDVVAEDIASLSVGIGVVSTDAAGVGASALPDPQSELSYPWLYWASFDLFALSSVTSEWAASAAAQVRWSFDIKSQRKLAPQQSLALIFELSNGAGNPTVHIETSPVRILVLE